jgi:hypothetical protein
LIRFAAAALAVAVVVVLALHASVHLGWLDALPSFTYQTAIFLVFTTIVIYVYLYKVNKPDFFVQLYLLTMAVKLLGYGAYAVFMILEDQHGAGKNVVFFLLLYVVMTALEISFLYRKIAGQNPQ